MKIRYFLFLFLCFSQSAFSADSFHNLGLFSSQAAACAAVDGNAGGGCSKFYSNYSSWSLSYNCPIPRDAHATEFVSSAHNASPSFAACAQVVSACPEGYEFYNNKCVPKCPEGSERQSDGSCSVPCTAGQSSSASFYRGDFSISTEAGVFVGTAGPRPTSLCDGQCTGTVVGDPWDACQSDLYASPSSPSAVTCTATISLTGSSCTGGNGNAPIYTDPSNPGTNTGDSGATDETGTASNAGTNNGTCANGATNYPACTTGNQEASSGSCGGEGQPACRYAIDETGVDTGVDRNPGELGANAYADDRQAAFDGQHVSELPWTWNLNIPSEVCHPLDWSVLGKSYTYDPCPLLTRVRTALAYLYFFLCCFYLWSRVTNATGGVK